MAKKITGKKRKPKPKKKSRKNKGLSAEAITRIMVAMHNSPEGFW